MHGPDPALPPEEPLPAEYAPRSVPAVLAARAQEDPDGLALVARLGGAETAFTFARLWHDSGRLAAGLAALGVTVGTPVAWLLDNARGGEALLLYHALLRLGAVNVPVNARLAPPEVRHILEHSGARLCVADAALLTGLGELPARTVAVGGDAAGAVAFEGLFADGGAPGPDERPDEDALETILYTSGTTGLPKGVLHSHGSAIASGIGWADAFRLRPGDVLQSPFPVFSGAALHFNALSCLWSGAVYVVDGADVDDSLRRVARLGATVFVAVPAIYQLWLGSAVLREADLSRLRLLDYGGASMAPALIERLREALPGVGLMQTYGLTEGGPGGTYLPEEYALDRLGSIGSRPAGRFTRFRVVDDAGRPVGPGGVGEFQMRGPSVMRGYHRDPEATAATFQDGWLRSGDVVRIDAQGFLYHLDRKKDIIVRGGFNIASAEVEAALLAHPEVLEAAVVAKPHVTLSEDIKAYVVLRRPDAVTPAELGAHCRTLLADFKVPRDIELRHGLPRNAAGKVLKRALRDEATRSTHE